jgi:ubiquinone/menaquinone biosynthesis C-methylase UbiE
MTDVPTEGRRHQEDVNAAFQSQSLSSYWKEIYTRPGVQARTFQDRHALVLQWVDGLGLAPGSRVLEVGCGTGLLAVELVQRGFRVDAVDSSKAMVELAQQRAAESGAGELLSLAVGDVNRLAFEDASFDLVIAVGLISWVERPKVALQEMARVTTSDGHVLFTVHNRLALNHLLDPLRHPALRPFKVRLKGLLDRAGLRPWTPTYTPYSRRYIDHVVAGAGLIKMKDMTRGFEPFTLLRRGILPEPLGLAIYSQLQSLAARNVPILRSTGSHYHVLVVKPTSAPGYRPDPLG